VPRACITLSGQSHHMLGAVKAANSPGPGNVELRKRGHQQGEIHTQGRRAVPRAETARDRCALTSQWRQHARLGLVRTDAKDFHMRTVRRSYSYRVASTMCTVHAHIYMVL
jgi:hypothetical protein